MLLLTLEEDRWTAERCVLCVCVHSPLKKMVVGMLLASVAFVIAAFVQMEIDVSTALAAAPTRTLAQTLRLDLHRVVSRKRCQTSRRPRRAK